MATPQLFSDSDLEMLDKAKILGVRAGTDHRYTKVWVVVIGRRVFARSWGNKPTGWYRASETSPRVRLPLAIRRSRSAPVTCEASDCAGQ